MSGRILWRASLAALLVVGGAWVSWRASLPARAQQNQRQRMGQRRPFTVRVVFGLKDQAATVWSGQIRVQRGVVSQATGWRTLRRDTVGPTAFRVQTRPLQTGQGQQQANQPVRIVPAGITIYGQAANNAVITLAMGQRNLRIPLVDLAPGQKLELMDGQVEALGLPRSTKLTLDRNEEDFPHIVGTENGAWAVWSSYSGGRDEVRISRYARNRWYTFSRVPSANGDIWKPRVGVDGKGRVWVVWAQQLEGNWDIYARPFLPDAGEKWGRLQRLTKQRGNDINPALASGPQGALSVVWQAFNQDGDANIHVSSLKGDKWTAPAAVTAAKGNDWDPSAAYDANGGLHVVWDSYRNGDYDVFYRPWDPARGQGGKERVIAKSPYAERQATVAVDKAGRIWIAYDRAEARWGKDQGYTVRNRRAGSGLGGNRQIRIRVLESPDAPVQQPVAGPETSMPMGGNQRRFLQWPRLAVDSGGRVWLHFRQRQQKRQGRRNRSYWVGYVTRLQGDAWTPALELPNSWGRITSESQIAAGPDGRIWLTWPTDNRGWNNLHQPIVNQVYAGYLSAGQMAPATNASLTEAAPEPPHSLRPGHRNEAADLKAIRAYTVSIGRKKGFHIVRGDLHRHTELSWDGGGGSDGSMQDFYRYMIDAASMDFGAMTDHNGGGDHEYSYWMTEKTTDLYNLPGRYISLYGYERSATYPNGHRNIIHAKRGVPIVSFFTKSNLGGARPGVGTGNLLENDTKLLYETLYQTNGISIPHTSGTRMGTDWRDNDPNVEPVVEIFQGARTSYEIEGAPRTANPTDDAGHVARAGFEPKGFVNNAWDKGYRLGTITSSDHGSTHISYAMVFVDEKTREGVLDGIRKRRTYGATDNIILDYRMNGHFMGEEFSSRQRPRISLKVIGTGPIAMVEIIRDSKVVYTANPNQKEVSLEWTDGEPATGTSYYYVRVRQADEQIAWSSPIWYTRK